MEALLLGLVLTAALSTQKPENNLRQRWPQNLCTRMLAGNLQKPNDMAGTRNLLPFPSFSHLYRWMQRCERMNMELEINDVGALSPQLTIFTLESSSKQKNTWHSYDPENVPTHWRSLSLVLDILLVPILSIIFAFVLYSYFWNILMFLIEIELHLFPLFSFLLLEFSSNPLSNPSHVTLTFKLIAPFSFIIIVAYIYVHIHTHNLLSLFLFVHLWFQGWTLWTGLLGKTIPGKD